MKNKLIILCLFVLAAFIRLHNLNWDNGHYLHPDERLYVNASGIKLPASLEEFLSPTSPLNPKMFYYGSFPLFVYKSINEIVLPRMSFPIVSRLVSSIVSITTIPVIFFIAKEIFSIQVGLLSAFVFAFAPGNIQHAHFNTTESILSFSLSLMTLFSIKAVKQKKYAWFIPLGILTGLSYASKITGLSFIILPLLAFIFLAIQEKNRKKIIVWGIIFTILIALSGLIAAPYQLIDYPSFKREQDYMQGVTYGKDRPVFVIIYEHTLPYIYPLVHVLPFTFGFLALPMGLIGLFLLLRLLKKDIRVHILLLSILIYPLFYFSWAGAWYVKFSRYFILLFPYFAIWTGYALSKMKRLVLILFLILIGTNGLLFTRIYLAPHTRIQASQWVFHHVPAGSTIAGEHWDDNLPLPLAGYEYGQYKTVQLPVYDEPDTAEKVAKLATALSESDYFVLTSRRVYQSILNNPKKYPLTVRFYQALFNGQLGFNVIKKFTNYPYIISDDFADETFQSYDHPPVSLFQNEKKYSSSYLMKGILEENSTYEK